MRNTRLLCTSVGYTVYTTLTRKLVPEMNCNYCIIDYSIPALGIQRTCSPPLLEGTEEDPANHVESQCAAFPKPYPAEAAGRYPPRTRCLSVEGETGARVSIVPEGGNIVSLSSEESGGFDGLGNKGATVPHKFLDSITSTQGLDPQNKLLDRCVPPPIANSNPPQWPSVSLCLPLAVLLSLSLPYLVLDCAF
jgi:hypothetical protein